MTARAEATAATRDAILDAATDQFLDRWFDEVTLAGVAEQAGVSTQTVVNHFGSKEGLLEATVARIGPERARRSADGDPVARVVADYEHGGDATIRMLALEERVPGLAAFLAAGRAGHRAWVQEAFADRLPAGGPRRASRPIAVHVAATDIYVWKLLRRDMGLSRRQTIEAMRRPRRRPRTMKERDPPCPGSCSPSGRAAATRRRPSRSCARSRAPATRSPRWPTPSCGPTSRTPARPGARGPRRRTSTATRRRRTSRATGRRATRWTPSGASATGSRSARRRATPATPPRRSSAGGRTSSSGRSSCSAGRRPRRRRGCRRPRS